MISKGILVGGGGSVSSVREYVDGSVSEGTLQFAFMKM
jgi:hypothetical protein